MLSLRRLISRFFYPDLSFAFPFLSLPFISALFYGTVAWIWEAIGVIDCSSAYSFRSLLHQGLFARPLQPAGEPNVQTKYINVKQKRQVPHVNYNSWIHWP